MSKWISNDIAFQLGSRKLQYWPKFEWNRVGRSTFRFQGTYLKIREKILKIKKKNNPKFARFCSPICSKDKHIPHIPLPYPPPWNVCNRQWFESLFEDFKRTWKAGISIPTWHLRILEFGKVSDLSLNWWMFKLNLSPTLSIKFLLPLCLSKASLEINFNHAGIGTFK